MVTKQKSRCAWAKDDPLYLDYHDHEWGVPVYDDHKLFEFLILEGMQAGLSWITILRKREHYRKAFDDFSAVKMARYSENKVAKLMTNPGIIRNRLKITAAINNAKCFLHIQKEHGSFADYLWQFVDGKPIHNHWRQREAVPAKTTLSDRMAKELKKKGFKFVGSTICYAFMQAVGMVNDHTQNCFRYRKKKR